MAIPFSYKSDRWVVIAPLAESVRMPAVNDFFEALEKVTIPTPVPPAEQYRFPYTLMEPSILSFGLDDEVHHSLVSGLAQRGWPLERASNFGELSQRVLQKDVPDIIVVDVARLSDPISAVASIHRIVNCSTLRILAFCPGDFPSWQSRSLIDRCLPYDAPSEAIFKAVKELTLEAGRLRSARIEMERLLVRDAAVSAQNPKELVDFASEKAAAIMQGWGCCFLLDEQGTVFRSEFPAGRPPVVTSIPKNFLSGASFFSAGCEDGFFEKVSDVASERDAFLAMAPSSAAAVALVDASGLHRGVLIACSIGRQAAATAFEAIDGLGQTIVERFGELLQGYRSLPEIRKERWWERLRDRAFGLDVYRSSDCAIPWRYRLVTETRGLLTLNLKESSGFNQALIESVARELSPAEAARDHANGEAFFAASFDFHSKEMEYATQGFSAPIFLNQSGPAGTIATSRGVTSGVAVLKSPRQAVVCDGALWGWLGDRFSYLTRLHETLDLERPQGLASIITLG